MTPSGQTDDSVAPFPLVGARDSDAEGLVAIIRRLSVAHSLDEVMDIVTHAARVLLRADGITFVLRDGDRCHYVEEDSISPLWKGQRFPMSACISGWCMEHGQAVAIPDIYQDPRIPQDAYRPTFVRSLAMAPVRQEDPVAALGAYWAAQREIQPAELELLQTIANAAALAIAFVQVRGEEALAPRGQWPLLIRPAHRLLFLGSLAQQRWRVRGPGNALVRAIFQPAWVPSPHPALWRRVLFGLGAVALALGLRLAAAPLMGGEAPYAPFFVAALAAAVWGGRAAGVTATLAGGLVANLAFVGTAPGLDIEGTHLWGLLSFWLLAGSLVAIAEIMTGTMRRELVLNRRLEVVGRELQHRIKNFITITQALAQQTGRNAQDIGEFERKFGERLQALAGAQSLLAPGSRGTAPLAELVAQILAPYRTEGRVELLGGPDVRVDEQLAVAIALLLNELATNAIKYGALSVPEGCVDLMWKTGKYGVRLQWLERGGPPVDSPRGAGFGSRLMKMAMPRSRGRVQVDYDPQGLRCRIEFEPAPQ